MKEEVGEKNSLDSGTVRITRRIVSVKVYGSRSAQEHESETCGVLERRGCGDVTDKNEGEVRGGR
jgi:hypothetical protein